MRKVVIVAVTFLLLIWLPFDLQSIRDGLEGEPRLALGISLKLLMHILAIWGLVLDKTFGYAFLLGATLQGGLVAYGAVQAVPSGQWWTYKTQLLRPGFDLSLRVLSLAFLLSRPGRMIGKEAST